jgi:hypothetical protein
MRASLKGAQNAVGIRLGEDGRMKRTPDRRSSRGVACIGDRELGTLAAIRIEVEIRRSLPHTVSADLTAFMPFGS